jgi:hypothetical protein
MQESGTKNDYKGKVSLHKPKAPPRFLDGMRAAIEFRDAQSLA